MGKGSVTRKRSRGMALATALMLSILVLVLGMTLLTTSQRDLFFQRQQHARDKADALARSGWEYGLFLTNTGQMSSTVVVGTPVTLNVVNPTEVIVLETREESGTGRQALVVQGVVKRTNGEVLGSRTLVVPYGVDNTLNQNDFLGSTYAE